ncbi:MAG: UDP-3-O-(3-hydroxymyristoyl)glucosamine N-acyltransferase [Planctomycetaceae bacterium]|jgi:UDP-3-O-[3-hydroxymyristoyl] glucosamine N-acyltransferase|nr:UDP-3-O-(3-hydroxymyristoyl)glucosamine N-acyltransferase [Planctomycetaceae bacterium]
MAYTLAELAELVGGTVAGNQNPAIYGAAPLHHAGEGDVTFLAQLEKISQLAQCKAAAVVVPRALVADPRFAALVKPMIQADDVVFAFETIVRHFSPPREQNKREIHPEAIIAPTAVLGEDVSIAPYAVIEKDAIIGDRVIISAGVKIMAGCKIGGDTMIFPNAVLYENTVVGERCIIHACAVLGAYGFGYDSSQGIHVLSQQLGNTVLGNDVEVGACSTIDRGTYSPTLIGDGTKIDNLVMVAHNCRIGKHNLICAGTGIAGSSTTDDYVVMAGRVGVRDHVHIGKGAVLGAMAGVISNVPDGARVVGIPATPEKEQMRMQVAKAKLPEMRQEMKKLTAAVAELQQKLARLENGE